jgi:hypothetical protein
MLPANEKFRFRSLFLAQGVRPRIGSLSTAVTVCLGLSVLVFAGTFSRPAEAATIINGCQGKVLGVVRILSGSLKKQN